MANGLRISDGKVPDPGVCNDEAALARLSNPAAAAMVAVAVAEAIIACRRLQKCVTEISNEWLGNDDTQGLRAVLKQRR